MTSSVLQVLYNYYYFMAYYLYDEKAITHELINSKFEFEIPAENGLPIGAVILRWDLPFDAPTPEYLCKYSISTLKAHFGDVRIC